MSENKHKRAQRTDIPNETVQEAYAASQEQETPETPAQPEQAAALEAEQTGAAKEGKASPQTVTLQADEYERIQQELEKLRQQSKDYYEGWARERADFMNYRKRVERDQALMTQTLSADILKRHLPIIDDLYRALKNRPTGTESASWAGGIELIVRKFESILEIEGVHRIPAETEEFNPMRHEAITHEDSPDHTSGQIIEVVQDGYTIGDRVLRPAMVRVAR